MKRTKRMKLPVIAALLSTAIPLGIWAFYKPSRILSPERVQSVTCVTPRICLDDPSRYGEALALYADALGEVADAVGAFRRAPRIVFCSSEACFSAFGSDKASAAALGTFGIVVSPRGWEPHYLRHEMIHFRQAEALGNIAVLFKPEWFVEGMAYALSNDPRRPLAGRFERDRAQFETWYRGVGKTRLWKEAEAL